MKYMLIFKSAEDPIPAELAKALGEKARDWFARQGRLGRLVRADELAEAGTGKRIRLKNGGPTIVDGPFMESKEVIGGYAIIEVPDETTAVLVAQEWMAIWDATPAGERAEVEVRRVIAGR